MDPRFLIKTHTGALRPGNYSLLIAKCTFPNKGAYPENVARKLSQFLGESVAKYTLVAATAKHRGFGFLMENMIWSSKGHVINAVLKHLGKDSDNVQDYLALSTMEKIAYLRYFLETEGALILALSKRFMEKGALSYAYLKDNIQNIFEEIYESYIDMAPDLRSRVRIKEMLLETKRRKRSVERVYDPGTLPHKIRPHVEALLDLGLIVEKREPSTYYLPALCGGTTPLAVLWQKLGGFRRMEEVFSNDGYFPLIAEMFNITAIPFLVHMHGDELRRALFYGYSMMRDNVTGMADIDALVHWSCIKLLCDQSILVARRDIQHLLTAMRESDPSSARYHVDGKGRISYLILKS